MVYADIEKGRAYSREYNRKRRKDPIYLEYRKKYYREWYTKNGRNRAPDYIEAILTWRKEHPEAFKAYCKVAYALKIGKLVKPKKCSRCNRESRLSAHHEDYLKPLDVIWLCSSCHKKIHSI
ncbi:MAG TPA: hypothetical protein VFF49_11170 [Thermodesulfobacteriota bacterium]|nr:hypothetical protein [Thermodesulfobacteriota bacterium]